MTSLCDYAQLLRMHGICLELSAVSYTGAEAEPLQGNNANNMM